MQRQRASVPADLEEQACLRALERLVGHNITHCGWAPTARLLTRRRVSCLGLQGKELRVHVERLFLGTFLSC